MTQYASCFFWKSRPLCLVCEQAKSQAGSCVPESSYALKTHHSTSLAKRRARRE